MKTLTGLETRKTDLSKELSWATVGQKLTEIGQFSCTRMLEVRILLHMCSRPDSAVPRVELHLIFLASKWGFDDRVRVSWQG